MKKTSFLCDEVVMVVGLVAKAGCCTFLGPWLYSGTWFWLSPAMLFFLYSVYPVCSEQDTYV